MKWQIEIEFTKSIVTLFQHYYYTICAYDLLKEKCDYPLHLGVTEAGTKFPGTVRSSIAFGSLLSRGIGDTIRVSLTEDPVEEVKVAFKIFKSKKLIDTLSK